MNTRGDDTDRELGCTLDKSAEELGIYCMNHNPVDECQPIHVDVFGTLFLVIRVIFDRQFHFWSNERKGG